MEKIAYVFDQNDVARGFSKDSMVLRAQGSHELLDRVLESGHPGDYFIQGAILDIGGVNAVLFCQFLLLLLSVICVYSLVVKLGRSHTAALTATVLYMCLPGSLIQAHQLSSESIYNPLVVFGFYCIIVFFQGHSRYFLVVTGLFLLSLAMFVRPQLLLYPIVLYVIFAIHYRNLFHPRALTIFPVCYFLSAIWIGFVFQGSGDVSVGSKEYGPEIAFFKTAQRMSTIGHYEFEVSNPGTTTMPVGEFSTHVIAHPASFITLKTNEIINLMLNPGVFSVAAHHLDLFAGGGDTRYWKQLRDRVGISGTLKEILRRDSVTVFVFFGGAIVWGAILLLMAVGSYYAMKNNRITRTSKAIMLSCVVYGLLIVLVAGEIRWAHRTSVEFLLVIYFAIGVEQFAAWRTCVPAGQIFGGGVTKAP